MRPPYEEMRILSYGLGEEDKQRLRDQVPVIFTPSYAHFDFSGHDGWDRLRYNRGLSVICNPTPPKRLTPYAPPYVVLRGVEELRRILCPPANALIVLFGDPDPRFSAFPHLTVEPGSGKDPFLEMAAQTLNMAKTPCLTRIDGLLPDQSTEGPAFKDGYIVLTAEQSGDNPQVLRVRAQKTLDFAATGLAVEFVLKTEPADDAERAARASDALRRFAQWNPEGLPIVTRNSDLLTSALEPMAAEGALPADELLVDLTALWARLFPEDYCQHKGQTGADLERDIAVAADFFAPLEKRYHQRFDRFTRLLDLYRPESLDDLARAQSPEESGAEETAA